MSRSLPKVPALIFAVLAIGGFAWFFFAEDREHAYRVYLHNWLMFAALSQGALVLSCAMRLTNARWQGPVHVIVDSLGAFVPLALLLFLGIYVGRHEVFEFTHHPIAGKEWWFEEGFLFKRDVVALGWMTLLSIGYLYMSMRPRLAHARQHATKFRGLYAAWTSGWRGDAAEERLAERRLRKFAAILALSYGFCYSLIAVDMIMSLAPHWLSTMFPAYFAWGGFLSAVSLTALLCVLMRNSRELSGAITESRRHDLGKMVFAFSIFWMYLFWSQYLVIWYGNIPEETGFLMSRLGSQFLQDTWYLDKFWTRISEPYVKVTLLVWFLCWVSPFWILLGQKPKKAPAILGAVTFGSVLGFWLERYILVTPSLVSPAAVLDGASITPFGFTEIAIGLGFLGLFFLSFLSFGWLFPGAMPAPGEEATSS